MASLSSLPRRGVTAAPVGLLKNTCSNPVSASVVSRRNYWIHHHFRQVAVRSASRGPKSSSAHESHGEQSKPSCYYGSYGGMRWGWLDCGGREDGWRVQKWAFIRRLSGGGSDGGSDGRWGDRNSKFPSDKNYKEKKDNDFHYEDPRTLLSDFLSPDYEARFLTWKEKEQRKLLERLRKEFEEQEQELLDRQRREAEEVEKREWKLWKKEFKEARGFEEALRDKEKWDKEKRGEEREKELEKERQLRNAEHAKNAGKPVPHPVPMLHPYSRVPIYEREMIDPEELTEVRRKGVDRDAVAYKEQKGQPGKEGVEAIDAPLIVEAAGEGVEEIDAPLIVEAAGEGVVDPVGGLEVTTPPKGVEPLNGAGLSVTQAAESPVLLPPVAEKSGEEVPEIVLPELAEEDGDLPVLTQSTEEKMGEVGDAPILLEAPTGESADQGLRPVVVESAPEVSAPNTEGGPAIVPPPPPAEHPVEEPPIAAVPPFAEPVPPAEPAQKVEEATTPSLPSSETPVPDFVTTELSQIKDSLSKVTTIVNKLDSTLDYELNSILIQLRLWRRELDTLTSTSNILSHAERKLFIKDEEKQKQPVTAAEDTGPREYKILTLSPSQPYHIQTTDLTVENPSAAERTKKDITEFLPNLKEPHLFLQKLTKLCDDNWELLSGGPAMLIFSRQSNTRPEGLLPTPKQDCDTTAVIPIPSTTKAPSTEVKTVFESGSTRYLDPTSGTLILPNQSERKVLYNLNDDGHLHIYGHGLGGIAGDGVSFSGVSLSPRVNPIDMTTRFEEEHSEGGSDRGRRDDGRDVEGEVDREERSRWDEKRTDAVRSMREVLSGNSSQSTATTSTPINTEMEKAREEELASEISIESSILESKPLLGQKEEHIRDELSTIDDAVHGVGSIRDAVAAEAGEAEREQEKDERGRKRGGRIGKFFKRLGWAVVILGGGAVAVKEVGYWSRRAEERRNGESVTGGGGSGEVGWGGSGEVGRGGRRWEGAMTAGETEIGTDRDGRDRWGGVGTGSGSGSGSGARPGNRYSWSERESVREGRWGGAGVGGSGRIWGEERR